MFEDVGMAVGEVWWMGGCLFQGKSLHPLNIHGMYFLFTKVSLQGINIDEHITRIAGVVTNLTLYVMIPTTLNFWYHHPYFTLQLYAVIFTLVLYRVWCARHG